MLYTRALQGDSSEVLDSGTWDISLEITFSPLYPSVILLYSQYPELDTGNTVESKVPGKLKG